MLGLSRSVRIAVWLVLAPIGVDLAHPLFLPCDGPADPAGNHDHVMSVSTHAGAPDPAVRPALPPDLAPGGGERDGLFRPPKA